MTSCRLPTSNPLTFEKKQIYNQYKLGGGAANQSLLTFNIGVILSELFFESS